MKITCAKLGGAGPGGQNHDIHLGSRLQRGYQVPLQYVTTGRYITITKPRSASLWSAISLGCTMNIIIAIQTKWCTRQTKWCAPLQKGLVSTLL